MSIIARMAAAAETVRAPRADMAAFVEYTIHDYAGEPGASRRITRRGLEARRIIQVIQESTKKAPAPGLVPELGITLHRVAQ